MITLRDADPARDAAACADIYAPFVAGSAVSFEEEPLDEAAMRQRITRIMQEYPWIVAEHDGALAGYAYASRHRERAAYRWAAEVAIYIGDGHRGRGVGRALYDALLALLGRQGIRVALAGITMPNPPSVALHTACGFRPIGTYRGIGWKAGAWRDVSWWQADLGAGSAGLPEEPRGPVSLGSSPAPGEAPASDTR